MLNSAEKISQIEKAGSLKELDDLRVSLLGKSGEITQALKELGKVAPEERKERGQVLNQLRDHFTQAIESRKAALEMAEEAEKLATETVDVSLPPRPALSGSIHPITQTMDEIISILRGMGFGVRTGPLLEDDFHNFTALNIPESHPARQMHDTFYVKSPECRVQSTEKPSELRTLNSGLSHVLRTHTSPVQIRTMMSEKPPIRIIAPGPTFRSDSDQTHTPMFHQVEGLLIDKDINMGHLKGCLTEFLRKFFGIDDLPIRFRPSFFPFTEPSAEVDIGCERTATSLKVGQGNDWLEVLGCGMVHPNVLKNCKLDPDEWQGFAFGMGVERLAMLKYNIPDLRTFFESDLRWLNYYKFGAIS